MWGNHVDIIRLKVSTFHSSKLMKKLLEDQNVIYISLLWSANKVQKFFFKTKQNKNKQKNEESLK